MVGWVASLYKLTASTSLVSAKESDCARVGGSASGRGIEQASGLLPDLLLSLTSAEVKATFQEINGEV